MSEKYQENLWGKIDYLHERFHKQYSHITNFTEILTKFQNSCNDFSKSINNVLNKNYPLYDDKTTTISSSIDSFIKTLNIHYQEFNETFNSIKLNIIGNSSKEFSEIFYKEKESYNSYTKFRSIYKNNKNTVEKTHKDFEQNSVICEKLLFNAKQMKMFSTASEEIITKNVDKSVEYLASTAVLEDKYDNAIKECNKSREILINNEKNLFNFYENVDNTFYTKIKSMMGLYLTILKKMYNTILIQINEFSEKYQVINIENDINDFINKNKTNIKPEPPINFIAYKPVADLNTNSITSIDKKAAENLDVNFEVLKTLKKLFKNIRPDLNMEVERKKFRLRYLSDKIFKIGPNVTFTKNEKNELISLFKDLEYRSYFTITLSKQRTNNRFQRSEILLNDLAELMEFILRIAEKEKDYENAKNCIVLSQTFYCEKNENNRICKKYLFDYIKNNKWLINKNFWEGVIEYMIQREIKKNDENNKDKEITENEKKNRLDNIVFSQVFSYTTNMLEFNFEKNVIIDIVNIFIDRYKIDKNMGDAIIDNVKNYQKNEEQNVVEEKENKKEEENININKNDKENFEEVKKEES